MSQMVFLGAAGLIGLVLTIVVASAPASSRTANGIAVLLAPVLGYIAWRVAGFIAPLAATIDARDPVEAFDLWMTGAAALLGLAAMTCVVRLVIVGVRRPSSAQSVRFAR